MQLMRKKIILTKYIIVIEILTLGLLKSYDQIGNQLAKRTDCIDKIRLFHLFQDWKQKQNAFETELILRGQ